jgi:hypothetical protein
VLAHCPPKVMQHAVDPKKHLILSAKSGGRRQSCETGDACLGRWHAIEPAHYP